MSALEDLSREDLENLNAVLGDFAMDAHATLTAVKDAIDPEHPLAERVQELLDRADVAPEDPAPVGTGGDVEPAGAPSPTPDPAESFLEVFDGGHGAQGDPATGLGEPHETPAVEEPWQIALVALEGDLAEFGYARMDNGTVPGGKVGYSLNGASLVLHTPVTARERLTFKAAAMEHGFTVQEHGEKGLVAFRQDAPDEVFVDAAPEPIESAVPGATAEAVESGEAPTAPDSGQFPALEKALALALELSRLFLEHNGEAASAEFVNAAVDLIEGLSGHVPEDVKVKAAEHAAGWDTRGWPE